MKSYKIKVGDIGICYYHIIDADWFWEPSDDKMTPQYFDCNQPIIKDRTVISKLIQAMYRRDFES